MFEADQAVVEIKRLLTENERQTRLTESTTRPDEIKLRVLANNRGKLRSKLRLIQQLRNDVKELEKITSLRMTSRYPEYQIDRQANRRELHRVRRQLKDIAARYQPQEKPKSRFAA